MSSSVLGGIGIIPLIALAGIILHPGALAKMHANLGAVAQTKAELSQYQWPQWPIQDALRRDPRVDISHAVADYQMALAIDVNNVTAHKRLGQIALSRGNYALAQQHLAAAYRASPEQRAIRQLLGETYAVTGQLQLAATLWQTINNNRKQLDARHWWYQYNKQWQEAGRILQVINQQ
jgi:predicted Zn-dependent protease